MLPAQHRLAKTTDIATVQSRGRRFFTPFFVVKALYKPRELTRFAFIVSTKVSKKAVDRNRIKRMMRQAVRVTLANFKPGDYVVIVKPPAVKLPSLELKTEFLKLLEKLK